MKEEIFGPILPIISFSNVEEAIQTANSNPNPLSMYIYSRNKSFIRKLLLSIPAGSAMINDSVVQFANRNLPFGGINSSGIGKAHGIYGFTTFSNEKSVMKQSKLSALPLLYPPYNNIKKKLIEIVIKYL
jgi:aldehyde dehydrogenase (NAD+)